jgi:hypothetical protein
VDIEREEKTNAERTVMSLEGYGGHTGDPETSGVTT